MLKARDIFLRRYIYGGSSQSVSDTFTDTAATLLNVHAPNTGPSNAWASAPDAWAINASNEVTSTPGLAANLVTNGSDWTGATGTTPPTGWTSSRPDAIYTIFDSGDGAPYDNCLKIENGGNSSPYLYKDYTTVTNVWYKASVRFKHGTGDNGYFRFWDTAIGGAGVILYSSGSVTDANWTIYTGYFKALSTTTHITLNTTTTVAGEYELFDEVTLEPLTTADLYALINTGTNTGYAYPKTGGYTIPAGGIQGVVAAASGPNPRIAGGSALEAVVDLTAGTGKLKVIQNGVETVIVDTAVTYAADAVPVILYDGTYAYFWYNNALVGTQQDVSAYTLPGTYWGMFSTGGGTCTGIDVKPLSYGAELLTAANASRADAADTDATTGWSAAASTIESVAGNWGGGPGSFHIKATTTGAGGHIYIVPVSVIGNIYFVSSYVKNDAGDQCSIIVTTNGGATISTILGNASRTAWTKGTGYYIATEVNNRIRFFPVSNGDVGYTDDVSVRQVQ